MAYARLRAVRRGGRDGARSTRSRRAPAASDVTGLCVEGEPPQQVQAAGGSVGAWDARGAAVAAGSGLLRFARSDTQLSDSADCRCSGDENPTRKLTSGSGPTVR